MSFKSIHSREYWEYCNSTGGYMQSNITDGQLKIINRYIKWISILKYEEINATGKLSVGQFKGFSINKNSGEASCDIIKTSNGGECVTVKLQELKLSDTEERILNNLKDELISELSYMCYIKDNNYTDEFESKRYKDIHEVLDTLYKSGLGSDNKVKNIYNFKYSNLPLPISLVNYYVKEIYYIYKETVADNSIIEALENIGEGKHVIHTLKSSDLFLLKLINSKLRDDEQDKEELLNTAVKFNRVYEKLSNGGKTDFDRLINASQQTVLYVTTALGERLATKSEVKSIVSGVYKKDVYLLDKDKRRKLFLFGWCITGEESYYYRSCVNRYEENERLSNIKDINSSLDWLYSDEFMKEDLKELAKGLKQVEYPDTADDEIKDDSLVAMLKLIKKERSDGSTYENIAYDIAVKCIKYNNYEISEKQLHVVTSVYNKLTNKDKPKERPEYGDKLANGSKNYYDDDLINKIGDILKNRGFSKKRFAARIIESVLQYQRCSEKQYAIIMDEYNRLITDRDNPVMVFGIGDTKDSSSKNSFFIEDDDNNVYSKKNSDDIEKAPELGKLSDISNSLGLGGM